MYLYEFVQSIKLSTFQCWFFYAFCNKYLVLTTINTIHMFNLFVLYPTHTYGCLRISYQLEDVDIRSTIDVGAPYMWTVDLSSDWCSLLILVGNFRVCKAFCKTLCVKWARWPEKLIRTLSFYLNFKFVFEANKKKGIEMFQLFEELLRPGQSPYQTIFKNILLIFISFT